MTCDCNEVVDAVLNRLLEAIHWRDDDYTGEQYITPDDLEDAIKKVKT